MSDRYAVFVAAGSSGDGTQGSPAGTLGAGVTAAKARGLKRVLVCDGEYEEGLTVTGATGVTGLQVFGGFKCPGVADAWTYEAGGKAVVAPKTGSGLKVEGAQGLTVQDVTFKSADAADAGASSVAALVTTSQGVVLRRVTLTAGKGADGVSGTPGAPGAPGAAPTAEQNGKAPVCDGATSNAGGDAAGTSVCSSIGGTGGAATRSTALPGTDGAPGTKVNGGAGATSVGLAFPGTSGTIGDPGADGTPGAAAAMGAFTVDGFAPANGSPGVAGTPGQGGGGGGASKGANTCTGASGGAGGMGGCGGGGGGAGTGGGASVALLSWDSTVTLEQCELKTASGGKGGAGAEGGSGGDGASGGQGGQQLNQPANKVGAGGSGGPGGSGGFGGSGSGGSGGPSIAVVFHGTAVSTTGTTLTPGTGGLKGAGAGAGPTAAPAGSDGMSAETYEQP